MNMTREDRDWIHYLENTKSVLVAVDFSKESEIACSLGNLFALEFHAKLCLFHHCTYLDDIPAYVEPISKRDLPGVVFRAKEALKQFAQRRISQDRRLKFVITHKGSLQKNLLRYCREQQVGLVITGTRGRKGLERFALGSVAGKILRTARCNVLVAKERKFDFPKELSFAFRRIIVAVDFSRLCDLAISQSLALRDHLDSSLLFVHVASSRSRAIIQEKWGRSRSIGNTKSDLKRAAFQELRKRVSTFTDEPGCHDYRIVEGDPVKALLDQVRQVRGELIVLGAHTRSKPSDFFLGSTAERIVRESRVPVLVIK